MSGSLSCTVGIRSDRLSISHSLSYASRLRKFAPGDVRLTLPRDGSKCSVTVVKSIGHQL